VVVIEVGVCCIYLYPMEKRVESICDENADSFLQGKDNSCNMCLEQRLT